MTQPALFSAPRRPPAGTAVFSADGRHRYRLDRPLGAVNKLLARCRGLLDSLEFTRLGDGDGLECLVLRSDQRWEIELLRLDLDRALRARPGTKPATLQ